MQSSCFGNHRSKLVNSQSAGSIAAHSSLPQAALVSARSTRGAEGLTAELVQSALPVQHLKVLPGWLAKLKTPRHKTAKLYPPHKFVQGLGVF